MIKNKLFKYFLLFWEIFVAKFKTKDEKSIRETIEKAEQKFLNELKEIRAEIKKLRESYEAALDRRRLADLHQKVTKSLSH